MWIFNPLLFMEKRRIKLKRDPEKEAKKVKKKVTLKSLFTNKKTRYWMMLACMLPFIIAIFVFGRIALTEAKNILALAKGSTVVETKPENVIEEMDYILRDNPTDLQKDYFKELKDAIEGEERADDSTIASLVAKNYVADFYTWTNKRGQYDVGGFYYIYDGEFPDGDHFKENSFLKARDGFYKYISSYGTQYGKENLIEVEDVEVVSCSKMSSPYEISEHLEYRQDSAGEWYDYRVANKYDGYNVSLRWKYKENTKLNLSQFATSINLAVIKRNGRFEIVEASESAINGRKETSQVTETQTETSEETTE